MKNIIISTILASLGFAAFVALFTIPFFNYYPILTISTILFGFFWFWIWSFLFQLFFLKKTKETAKEIEKEAHGKIYYQGLANHFVGMESVGGSLFITKDKLIFKSHSFNIHNHSIEILLKNINEVKTYNTLGIIPNGLKIIQKEKTDKFVVNSRTEIMKILNKKNK